MSVQKRVIGIKGAGEMASAVAWRLYMANFTSIFMMEIPKPLAVRREVSFCEAIYEKSKTIEGVKAVAMSEYERLEGVWEKRYIAVLADPKWTGVKRIRPDVVIDAILAKKNLGTRIDEGNLVIGLGPGFVANNDVHLVIETNRGHHLGRIITKGGAEANTGIPGNICGFTDERVFRAPKKGIFTTQRHIGESIAAGEVIGTIDDQSIRARISGVIRGLIRSGTLVLKGLKLGDIDPRNDPGYCNTISDKARAISGSVLEAILRVYNEGHKR
jgi:xanthine dehydrogenase accessory factor